SRTGLNHITTGTVQLNNASGLGSGIIQIDNNGVLELPGGVNLSAAVVVGASSTILATGPGAVAQSVSAFNSVNPITFSTGTSSSTTLAIGNTTTGVYGGGSGSKTVVTGRGKVILVTSNTYSGDW